jgi:uncharacterized DUF497 family protein
MRLESVVCFEWDLGSQEKNWQRHQVFAVECEQVLLNNPLVFPDPRHSHAEERLYALGKTNSSRLLFIAFTIRRQCIRVISARDMSKKEQRYYEKEIEKNSIL